MNNGKRDKGNNNSYIFTRETMGTTLLLFCAIVFVMLLTRSAVFAGIGRAVCTFMYGTFGYGSYLLVALLGYLGFWLVFEKKIKVSFKPALLFSLCVFSAFLLFHAVSSRNLTLESYGKYIAACYSSASLGYSGYTFGGVISALVVYPVAKLTTFVGAYIIFSLLLILFGYLTFLITGILNRRAVDMRRREAAVKNAAAKSEPVPEKTEAPDKLYSYNENMELVGAADAAEKPASERKEPPAQVDDSPYSRENLGRRILFENGEFAAESYRRNMIFNEDSYFNHPVHNDGDYLRSFSDGRSTPEPESYTDSYQSDIMNKPASNPVSYLYGEKPVDSLEGVQTDGGTYPAEPVYTYADYEAEVSDEENDEPAEDYSESYEREEPPAEFIGRVEARGEESDTSRGGDDVGGSEEEDILDSAEGTGINIRSLFSSDRQRGEDTVQPDSRRVSSRRTENENMFDDDEIDISFGDPIGGERTEISRDRSESSRRSPIARDIGFSRTPEPADTPAEEEKAEEKPKHVWKKYVRPSLELLKDYPESNNVNTGEIEDNKRAIVETLARFKIGSEITNVTIGPAITRYDVIIEDKTKIKQALNYKEAIAMSLMKDNVNAYLNYSKGALSIEVPNNSRTIVGLKTMLASSKFINCKPTSITFALGKNVEGEVVCPDITKMPHLLVAGTTGSGKSICLSSLIISLLYKYGPEELRFILVDPKQAEFIFYDKLPHLMINEIIYEVDKAIKALNWAIKEMERRYVLFKEMTERGTATKNLDEYNSHLPPEGEKLPKIVIILDEFGDLMLQAKKDIETRIIKLVQKARACGIHIILATQRPSVDCITGLIKSNLPTRIGFKVNSFDDSRTIFDIGGAEKLLGMGDMYFRSTDNPDLVRIQGCFIDTPEVQRVTDFIKENNETYFDKDVSDFINKVEAAEESAADEGSADGDAKIDDTFINALKYCVTSNQASVSMIQRRFPVGYIKACKIIDWMENMNYITHSEGSKPRKVLMTKEEFDNTFGDTDV